MSTTVAADWPSSPSAYLYDDVSGHIATFKDTSRLFVESDSLEIQACIANSSGSGAHDLSNMKELVSFMDKLGFTTGVVKNQNKSPTAHIFLLRQRSSRGSMVVPQAAMKHLLHEFQVSSAFVNILTCFGAEDGPYTDGRSSYYGWNHGKENGTQVFETAYILKYVEKHGRADRKIPWSVRQMALHQRFEASTKQSSCLLIQASARAEHRLADAVGEDAFTTNWTAQHECVLGTLSYGWAQYIRFLDIKISEESLVVRYSKVGAPTSDRVTFAQLQQLNEYSDLLIRISHALDLNIEVLGMLAKDATTRESLDSKLSVPRYEGFRSALRACTTEHIFLKRHVSLVRECTERLGIALRDTIALQDSNAMLHLTHKTIYEAQSMKTITLVALVFLPASFAAAFLSMGYISVDSLEGIMALSVNRNMWLYLAITLPLMAVTLLGWWLWERRIRRRDAFRQGMDAV